MIRLYYTQISLGTPPRQYNVFVDTGSDLTWVNCAPCTNCPVRTAIDGVRTMIGTWGRLLFFILLTVVYVVLCR